MQKLAPACRRPWSVFYPNKLKRMIDEKATKEEVTEALVLHAFRSLVEKRFANENKNIQKFSAEFVIKDVATYVTGLFKTQFERCDEMRRKGKQITSADFAPFSASLVSLMLPKPHFLANFVERRKETLLAPLSEIILNSMRATAMRR